TGTAGLAALAEEAFPAAAAENVSPADADERAGLPLIRAAESGSRKTPSSTAFATSEAPRKTAESFIGGDVIRRAGTSRYFFAGGVGGRVRPLIQPPPPCLYAESASLPSSGARRVLASWPRVTSCALRASTERFLSLR